MLRVHADGIVSDSEQRAVVWHILRFPLSSRTRLVLSWAKLKEELGQKPDPANVLARVVPWAPRHFGATSASAAAAPDQGAAGTRTRLSMK
jgi:hypothetical protein